MLSARVRWASASTVSFVASLLLAYPARRLDALRFDCDLVRDAGASAVVLAIVIVVLAAAWIVAVGASADGACDGRRALGSLAAAIPANVVAACSPAFLSKDVVYYGAIGRAIARYDADPYAHISQTLPPSDPYWLALPTAWRNGTSAYFPGFHAICAWIGSIAGDDVRIAIHLHQALALTAMLAAAWLAGDAVERATHRDLEMVRPFLCMLGLDTTPDATLRASRARAATMALIGLAPLTILEAASSAHNDAWLALATSGAAALVVRDRPIAACAVVTLGALVKASGAMSAAIFAIAVAGAFFRSRRAITAANARRLAWLSAIVAVALAGATLPLLRRITESLEIGGPPMTSAASVEAIPRAMLFAAGATTAERVLVFAMRAAGVAWLVRIAAGALEDGRVIARVAVALFGFYVYFAGWSHAWYLLPVLAIAPFSDPRWLRSISATFVLFPLTYVVVFSFPCGYPSGWTTWTLASITQGLLVVGGATALRLHDRRQDSHAGARGAA